MLIQPHTLAGALEALRRPASIPLAGGQIVLSRMNAGQEPAEVLVSLGRVRDLGMIRATDDGGLRIGAMVTVAELERIGGGQAGAGARLLAVTAAQVAHPAIRAAATLGGTVAAREPLADLPVSLLALDATVVIASLGSEGASSEREVSIERFLADPARPGEVVVAVKVPGFQSDTASVTFLKLNRVDHDYAFLSVAVCLAVREGKIAEARLSIGGGGARPIRAREAEALLSEVAPDDKVLWRAAQRAADICDPIDDVKASARYRQRVLPGVILRALQRVRENAAEPA
jgi:CO/xanthine dehydrogenase FAD-binding subunit